MKSFADRVKAGAEFLDAKLGRSWARKIKLRRLNLAYGYFDEEEGDCGCILAQLDDEGYYSDMLDELGIREQSVALGFNVAPHEKDYARLTELWKDQVRARR